MPRRSEVGGRERSGYAGKPDPGWDTTLPGAMPSRFRQLARAGASCGDPYVGSGAPSGESHGFSRSALSRLSCRVFSACRSCARYPASDRPWRGAGACRTCAAFAAIRSRSVSFAEVPMAWTEYLLKPSSPRGSRPRPRPSFHQHVCTATLPGDLQPGGGRCRPYVATPLLRHHQL